MTSLRENSVVNGKSKLKQLHPFLDGEDILRVGGRLHAAALPYNSKHPMILPPKHHITKLLIEYEHQRLQHARPQLMIASLRETFWIQRIRPAVKAVIHSCIKCFKLKSSTAHQLMDSLPTSRIQPSRPFSSSGVDYAGPIYVKLGNARSKVQTKDCIAIFICLATKAIHIELVSDMTTAAFIVALRRFIARRGKCNHIYSDSGSNFVGAERELKKLFTDKERGRRITDFLSQEGCQWHFNPPNSPHQGGLWEAGVKSIKYHLRRVVGVASLTFEEMLTVLTQIEACLNSRPLCPLSDDPSDISFLTPGHFLTGGALTSLPEPDLCDVALHRLTRWQRVQQMVQRVWRCWSREYLHTLQQHQKWTETSKNLHQRR
ncbi:uncharacterized protein LOC124173310 [Ischnura elegans]|uniref:uncharacterized protein LOC124173310 n=1 Tax=Ischnura elegans TaxID=197161 RepID=UPI001ED887B7|nr:uncharacterized protein LOC124173310 [Ischnura elegans]